MMGRCHASATVKRQEASAYGEGERGREFRDHDSMGVSNVEQLVDSWKQGHVKFRVQNPDDHIGNDNTHQTAVIMSMNGTDVGTYLGMINPHGLPVRRLKELDSSELRTRKPAYQVRKYKTI